jgi:riboflavin synthase
VGADSFDLALIPETIRLTNLGAKHVGDRVNIELDARTVAVVETVERVLARRADADPDRATTERDRATAD